MSYPSLPFLKQYEGNSFKAHGGEERNMEATLSKQLFQSNLRATSTAGGEETGARRTVKKPEPHGGRQEKPWE